jgi:DeoR/GlpR family transcriptional regulator of sugar metabolism
MGSHQRQEEIVRLAGATGVPTVEELSTRFSVPASTIRRDLTKLQFLGLLARTCNGAKGLQSHPEDSVRHRNQKPFDAKRGIARWAAQQIHSGETVLLDTGSTVAALARQLRRGRALTVVTTSLAVLQELSGAESIQVLCLGGTLRYVSKGFIGPLAEAALERMTFDRAFLDADGIMAEDGICAADLRQTRLKELVERRAEQTYVLVHSVRLGRRPFRAWTPLPPGCTLVTDDSADSASLARFRDHGTDVIVVDVHGFAMAEV